MPDPIPPSGLLLHIGPPKTGSTALQHSFDDSREALAARGVHYAGAHYRPRRAGWGLLGFAPQGRKVPPIRAWQRLAAECAAHDDVRVCLSNEDLAQLTDEGVDRVVRDLGAERIHLAYVVRPLVALLPSQWQEEVKARSVLGYEEWLRHVLAPSPQHPSALRLRRLQDVEAIVARWRRHLGPDQITLICADPEDHSLLPRVFEELLDLPVGALAPDPNRSNVSLSYPEVEFVRAVNAYAVADEWSGEEYWRLVQSGLLRSLSAAPHRTGSRIPPMPAWARPLLQEWSETRHRAVVASGVRIVGDPQHLLRQPTADGVDLAEHAVTEIPLATAAAAVAGVASGSRRLRQQDAEKRDAERRRESRLAPTATSPAVTTAGTRELVHELRRRLSPRRR